MTAVLEGVRVLEVAEYAMAPAAAAVLADWGADVIKVEHAVHGDAMRSVSSGGVSPGTGGYSGLWEPFNRGKRSIAIDIARPEGRAVVLELARTADVFITNFLPATRKKLGLDVDDLRQVNPRLIYGRGSAYGPKGPEAGKGGFDVLAYWYRSGAGLNARPAGLDEAVPLPGPAFGDIQTGMALAGGLAAALYHRERTGEARVVDISLLSSGLWAMQTSLYCANVSGKTELPRHDRTAALNPLNNVYATRDGGRIALAMILGDRYWAELCRLIERDDLATDPRFADARSRGANSRACIQELDAVFARRDQAEWESLLSRQRGQWAVVRRASDANEDAQAWENGYLRSVDYGDGRRLTLVSAPVQFDETPPDLRPAPEFGAHTEEILLELGRDWETIVRLKTEGVIN